MENQLKYKKEMLVMGKYEIIQKLYNFQKSRPMKTFMKKVFAFCLLENLGAVRNSILEREMPLWRFS